MALENAGSGRPEAFPGVGGDLTEKFLEAADLAFVGYLLLLGVLDEFENLLHVGEGLMEGVHDPFDFQHGLFDRARGGRAVGQGLDGSGDGSARFLDVFLTGRLAAFGGIVPIPGFLALTIAVAVPGFLTATTVLTTFAGIPRIPGVASLLGTARSFLEGRRGRFLGVGFLRITGVGVMRFLVPVGALGGVVLGGKRVVGGLLVSGGLGGSVRVVGGFGIPGRREGFRGDLGFGVLRARGVDRRQAGGGFERGIGRGVRGGKGFLLTGLRFRETALGAEGAAAGAVAEGRTAGGTGGWILSFGTHELRIGMGR